MTHDEWLQRAADQCVAERQAQWAQARLAAASDPEHRRALAVLWRHSLARVRYLSLVGTGFAAIEPDPERSLDWHAAVVRAAHRTGRPVGEVFEEARTSAYGRRELAQLGRAVEAVSLATVCGDCGFRIVITCRRPGIRAWAKGRRIWCPVCRTDGRAPIDLGALA